MIGPLLSVKKLTVQFRTGQGIFSSGSVVRAVDEVSLDLDAGATLGLVGESGCGKTTLARAIMRLIEAERGEVWFMGRNMMMLRGDDLKEMRRHIQIVFQDPFSSLDPRMTVFSIVAEPLLNYGWTSGEAKIRVLEVLETVGLERASLRRYPHEFSGGQRQRIGIARALALSPKLLVCDEPVSSLDVSIQAQIINLLLDLRARLGIAMLFISHDLAVVRHVSDQVAVMRAGRIVEHGKTDAVIAAPSDSYTRMLLDSIPGRVLKG